MKKNEFDFKFLNIIMYAFALIAVFYVGKNLGVVDKILEVNAALVPVYIGIVICFLSMPLANRLRKMGMNKKVSSVVSLVIIYGAIIIVFSIVIPVFVNQLSKLVTNFPDIYASVVTKLNVFIHDTLNMKDVDYISTDIMDISIIKQYLNNILNFSINTLQSAISIIISVFTTIIVSFFLVKDMDDFKKKIINVLTNNGKNKSKYNLIIEIEATIKSYVKGLLIDSFIVGCLTATLCFILGIDYALVFGILIMILNFIPYIGAFLSEIIIALYAFALNGPIFAIVTFVLLLCIQLLDSNILQPNIVAKSVDLHPAIVFSGLLVGNILFGVWGMIIVSPILAICKIIIEYLIENKKMQKIGKDKINVQL